MFKHSVFLQTWFDESWNSRPNLQQPPIKFYMLKPRKIARAQGSEPVDIQIGMKPEKSSHFVEILRAL